MRLSEVNKQKAIPSKNKRKTKEMRSNSIFRAIDRNRYEMHSTDTAEMLKVTLFTATLRSQVSNLALFARFEPGRVCQTLESSDELQALLASSWAAKASCSLTAAATSGWLGTTDLGRKGAVGWKPVSSAYHTTFHSFPSAPT